MTAPTPLLDLDDGDALVAADTLGVLRSAAMGGAHIRATRSAVEEGALERLRGLRPRSVVVVTGSGRASRGAAILTAVLAERIGFPLVRAASTPVWVGPLDVVVVAGDDAGDPRLVQAIDAAVRRGAEVVVAAPDEGPLQAVAAGRVLMFSPRIQALTRHGLLRYFAVLLAVLRVVGSERWGDEVPDLEQLADAVDNEALRDRPTNEVFHNPAKSLASRMQGRRVVLTGDTESAMELARHGAEALLHAGRVATASELSDVLSAASTFRVAATVTDPIFHDPELDGPPSASPVRTFVFSAEAEKMLTERKTAVLGDADLVVAASDEATPPSQRSELEQAAVLVGRLDMTAAYLQLIGGI
ncbi:tobH protein [Rhodococcus tibetensis]|uniref:TobH protein n=1 Tax=Rhodococcus tibetensis TaxID=2965064 RepID=A0ABT1QGP7_9NOCA|nr:tobH protein [Rhodococcus sp. FXJ9.536]MCQ4121456.1 tobH protein [Rhodococcus sp. FXJ9.536]